MAEPTTIKREHFWVSNSAFARITGIKFVCMDCGLGIVSRRSPEARGVCPGRRAPQEANHA